jgi:hypothetical protein
MKRQPLYIETTIDCALEDLWEHTQNPAKHQQWDLRFSEITYLPKEHPDAAQHFLYSRKIAPGFSVHGIGESAGAKSKENGEATSALQFSSDNPLSLIKKGSGYWKYIPTAGGIKFLTGYNYDTRWGIFGEIIDKVLFRPLMIRATAWSFDCLKNWLEKDIHPRDAMTSQVSVFLANLALAIIWIYHGIFPKVLFPLSGEFAFLQQAGVFPGHDITALFCFGIMEIIFGILLLSWQTKYIHFFNIIVLIGLAAGSFVVDPSTFIRPFDPFTLNLAMIALSVIVLCHLDKIPRYKNCKMRQP